MKTDRSGRTLEEYRDLYWAEKKRRKELEAAVVSTDEGYSINGAYQFCATMLRKFEEYRKELEAVLIDAERDWEDERRKVRELEADIVCITDNSDDKARLLTQRRTINAQDRQLAAVRGVIADLDTQTTNGHAVRALRKALAGEEDE